MGLNHTIKLLNYPAAQGICNLINQGIWVDCIITKFNRGYFTPETIESEFENVADHMSAVLTSEGSVYIHADLQDIQIVIKSMTGHGFIFKNLLTIDFPATTTARRTSRYEDCGTEYVLFFGRNDHPTKYFNLTTHNNEFSCHYTADWSWFTGESIVDAYRMMMKISSNHADTILDPFMALGDVGVAAVQQDRHFIGIEADRIKYDYAKQRIDETGE